MYPNTVVQFTDESANPTPVAWLWNFGDGSFSTTQSPGHAFATPGNYSVMLTVWGSAVDFNNDVNGATAYGSVPVENYTSGSVIPTFVVTSLSINPPTLSVGDYAQVTVNGSEYRHRGGCCKNCVHRRAERAVAYNHNNPGNFSGNGRSKPAV